MAKVHIVLIPEHRDSLLASLPARLKVRALLQSATQARSGKSLFDDNYELVCDLRDARTLLETAKKSCPAAVEGIETVIKPHQPKNS